VLAALALIVTLATLAMPGSSNFVGEFMILLGLFKAKLAIALIASLGVVGAAVYALRLYIRSMHNRVGPRVTSKEIGLREAVAVVPVVLVILVFAFYPQFGLRRSQASLKASIAGAALAQRQSSLAADRGGTAVTARRLSLTASRTP
jgi:NADH-quinone oxidoreductase subunit M